MSRRPTLTAAGLLAESYGGRPYTVTIREEKAAGSNVILDYSLEGGLRRKRTLGYPVRSKARGRWEWDWPNAPRTRANEVRHVHCQTCYESVTWYAIDGGPAFTFGYPDGTDPLEGWGAEGPDGDALCPAHAPPAQPSPSSESK